MNPMLGFKSFHTAEQTIQGIETMHMIKNGQAEFRHSSLPFVAQFIDQLMSGLIT